jgi:hypothetical protein
MIQNSDAKWTYHAYEERKAIIHNQQSLFREIQLIQDPTTQLSPIPEQPTYTPYAQWQDDNGVDWAQLEALAQGDDFEEVSEDDEDGSDDE